MIFKEKKTITSVRIDESRKLLKEGLIHYVGGIPDWLPEYDIVVEWLSDNKMKGLLAVGDYGRGKTLICYDIIPDILENFGIKCFRTSAYSLERDLDGILSSNVLVIDDVGVEGIYNRYGTKRDLMCEIIDNAERNAVLLILTTNLTIQELTERYGARIIDRLKSIAVPIVFKGESLRGKPVRQYIYAYNTPFETQEEADKFIKLQEEIYDGLNKGKYKAGDISVWSEMEFSVPLKLVGDMVYLYD